MFALAVNFSFASGEWREPKPFPLLVWEANYDFIPLDSDVIEDVFARPPPELIS